MTDLVGNTMELYNSSADLLNLQGRLCFQVPLERTYQDDYNKKLMRIAQSGKATDGLELPLWRHDAEPNSLSAIDFISDYTIFSDYVSQYISY